MDTVLGALSDLPKVFEVNGFLACTRDPPGPLVVTSTRAQSSLRLCVGRHAHVCSVSRAQRVACSG